MKAEKLRAEQLPALGRPDHRNIPRRALRFARPLESREFSRNNYEWSRFASHQLITGDTPIRPFTMHQPVL